MTIFSANSSTMFRTIKLRKKKSECIMCGDSPTITKLIDYVRFCGSSATDKTPDLLLIPFDERLTCEVAFPVSYIRAIFIIGRSEDADHWSLFLPYPIYRNTSRSSTIMFLI